ncbi:LCP family protein [Streptomyces tsukubensis]|uniref:LCP family protein n=1 Tax=Streptomyces tsukubensis TaxID=83656 RepID=UPI00098ECA85|nr:LCP family protein [Streptomyces tsukubensis]QFR93954.1 LytR family transcriptional regulator [Streptomyces tsukubensis]
MTDSSGRPADPDPSQSGSEEEAPAPSEGGGPRGRWGRWAALGGAVLVLAAGGVGWLLYSRLDGNISTDSDAAAELARYERERPKNLAQDAQNILLIGSDTRAGSNKKYGRDVGTQRSDTTILLHLAADRRSATAVSLPRDLMVEVPECRRKDGTRTPARLAQFNWAYEFGGTACTIRTVEKLTDVRVDHHMTVDFQGFKKMVNAVGGVRVCVRQPIDDNDAHVRLAAGSHELDGEQALGYVRARKSLGDGSDTERIERQQQFLAALVAKVQSNDVLLNPTKLYPVLDAATSALTTDPGLDHLRDLYELARGLRSMPSRGVRFMTVPRQSYVYDANRDQLKQPDADRLFEQLRNDSPVRSVPDSSRSSTGTVDSESESTEEPTEEPTDESTEESTDDGKRGAPSRESRQGPIFRASTDRATDCG